MSVLAQAARGMLFSEGIIMSVQITAFGTLSDGRPVRRVTLTNSHGTALSVLDYGATIQSLVFAGRDVVLGYDRIEWYEHANNSYIGATVGRYANRIADGQFTLEGHPVTLACNEASHRVHLHGGNIGFDRKVWETAVLHESTDPAVCFTLVSADGEEGFPGTLRTSVTFKLAEDDTVTLDYQAVTDKTTVLNLTNHTYFNLGGTDGGDVLDTLLCIRAEEYTPINERMIPTGELSPVAGTPLDFRAAKPIREGVFGEHPQIALAGGVDHNFVLSRTAGDMRQAAAAYHPQTDIRLVCMTDQPGIQVYTANFLDEQHGKQGVRWQKYGGFCLETQHFPDSVHQPSFPTVVLHPGEAFSSRTQFHFARGPIE